MEIVEEVPDLDAVVIPVGGGGLLAGIAVAVKGLRSDVQIIVRRNDHKLLHICPGLKAALQIYESKDFLFQLQILQGYCTFQPVNAKCCNF